MELLDKTGAISLLQFFRTVCSLMSYQNILVEVKALRNMFYYIKYTYILSKYWTHTLYNHIENKRQLWHGILGQQNQIRVYIHTAYFMKKVHGVYTNAMETMYLSLSVQVAVGTFSGNPRQVMKQSRNTERSIRLLHTDSLNSP